MSYKNVENNSTRDFLIILIKIKMLNIILLNAPPFYCTQCSTVNTFYIKLQFQF